MREPVTDYRKTLERWLVGLESLSQEEVQELVREALAEVERLKDEVDSCDGHGYLREEIAIRDAKIEAALSWVKPYPRPVSDAQTIDRMVEALKGDSR